MANTSQGATSSSSRSSFIIFREPVVRFQADPSFERSERRTRLYGQEAQRELLALRLSTGIIPICETGCLVFYAGDGYDHWVSSNPTAGVNGKSAESLAGRQSSPRARLQALLAALSHFKKPAGKLEIPYHIAQQGEKQEKRANFRDKKETYRRVGNDSDVGSGFAK
jgi:hypothetical protein